MMANVTVSVPDDFKEKMDEHSWVNWSEVARQGFRKKLEELEKMDEILEKSELTEEDVEKHAEVLKEKVWNRIKEKISKD